MTTTKYLSCADTAKLLRAALKEAFPGVKFGVRSSVYSGGASIYVKWTDGPTGAQVKAICDKFEGAYFDGMIDYKGTQYHSLDGQAVHFGADFIFGNRDYSDALLERAIATVAAAYGGCEPVTVEDWRKGLAWGWKNSGGCDLHQAVRDWLGGRDHGIAGCDSGRVARESATLARVAFTGDDGYGAGTVGRDGTGRDCGHGYAQFARG